MSDKGRSTGSVAVAFAVGALAGAVVALLFAPASGEETRRRLASKAREGRDKAEELMREGRDFIGRQRDHLTAAVERGRETYDKVRKETV